MRTPHQSSASWTFKRYQAEFHQALSDEIKCIRKKGSQKTIVTDGHYLGASSNKHLYSFTADTEIRLPDDTKIDVEIDKRKYEGTLISIEGFDLIIALDQKNGNHIPLAKISTEPWFLLETLQERLLNPTKIESTNRQLALQLLALNSEHSATNNRQFSDFSEQIQSQIQQRLNYNQYQSEAVTHVLQYPVSFIWGPPGTGKTSTLGLTVASLVHAGESVLVLAHSNAAVDTAMQSLGKYLDRSSYYQEGLILRFGVAATDTYKKYPLLDVRGVTRNQNPQLLEKIEQLEKERKILTQQLEKERKILTHQLRSSDQASLRDRLAAIRAELHPLKDLLKKKESELVQKATVVGCTLSKAVIASEIFNRQFDSVIVDEASMAYIPHCIYAATLAKKRIAIFGDFRQLGPIAQSEDDSVERWLKRDIFEEAGIVDRVNRNEPDKRMVLLQTQYRMHPSISAISNRLFYNGQLRDGEGVKAQTQTIVDSEPHAGQALVLYDLSHSSAFCFSEKESHSRFNLVSALVAADLAYKSQGSEVESIGIITPYKDQARLIHRILRDSKLDDVKASTVHRFQGSEQHLIIFDAVDSTPKKEVGKLLQGGLNSTASRLANVAISRAQGKFIGLFNNGYLQRNLDSFNIFRKFRDCLHTRSQVVPLTFSGSANSTAWQFSIPGVEVYLQSSQVKQMIQADLRNARDEVAIDWPTIFDEQRYFSWSVLKAGIQVFARGSKIQRSIAALKNNRFEKSDSFSTMGILGIDRKILWIYTNPSAQSLVFKITLPKTIELLYIFLQLVPADSKKGSAKQRIQNGFGSCEVCKGLLWTKLPEHIPNAEPIITCEKHPYKWRRMNQDDATQFAQINGRTCGECGAALKGCKNSTTGKIFLACTSGCGYTLRLRDIF